MFSFRLSMSLLREILRRSLGFNLVFNNGGHQLSSGRFRFALSRRISHGRGYDPSLSDNKNEEDRREREVIGIPALFIERIVGRGGATVKQISKRTGVVVNISRENPGQIDLLGSREGINEAKRLINVLCRQQASLVNKDMDYTSLPSMEVITIPSNSVGALIGRVGSTIQRIRDATGAQIFVPPDGSCRVEITGNPASIEAAKKEIQNVVTFGDTTAKERVKGEMREVITVPKSILGKIVGFKGATIKKLAYKTGAAISKSYDDSGAILIRGTPETISLAKEEINRIVRAVQAGDAQYRKVVSVPRTALPELVGTGGATISNIEKQTGTAININRDWTGAIEILGQEHAVNSAERLINEIVAQIGEEVVISVPMYSRNKIVGPGGSTVRQIEQETRTRIRVSLLSVPEVAISGSREGIDAAKRRIEELCQDLDPTFSSWTDSSSPIRR